MRNSNEIFKKDVTYDYIKIYKKAVHFPFSEKHSFKRFILGLKERLFKTLRVFCKFDRCNWYLAISFFAKNLSP